VSGRSYNALNRSTFLAALAATLAAAGLAASLLAPVRATAAAAPCGNANAAPGQLTLHQMRTSVLCLVNRFRVHYGLHTLAYNVDLRTSASAHSVSMVVNDYFSHEGPGGSVDGRISRAGYLSQAGRFVIGEDIGGGSGRRFGSPLGVVREWMHSPPHRENILDSSFRDAGVGVARGFPSERTPRAATYTMDFGARGE
jgi:uncharacterized protein YkwD